MRLSLVVVGAFLALSKASTRRRILALAVGVTAGVAAAAGITAIQQWMSSRAAGSDRRIRVELSEVMRRREAARADKPIGGLSYDLTIHIGRLSGESFQASQPIDIVAFASDTSGNVQIDDPVVHVHLTEHTVPPVRFRVASSNQIDVLRLRCNIYCRGALLQSYLVIRTGIGTTDSESTSILLDYSVNYRLDEQSLSHVSAHDVSILINDNNVDEHGLYVYSPEGERLTISAPLNKEHIKAQREWIEQLLTSAMDFRKSKLQPRLIQLAQAGRQLVMELDNAFVKACHDRGIDEPDDLLSRCSGERFIQVIYPKGCSEMLPAATFYDFDVSLTTALRRMSTCQAFFDDLASKVRPRCLDGCVTNSVTVVCPAGFWGFRTFISSPPSGIRPYAPNHSTPTDEPVVIVAKTVDTRFARQQQHLSALPKLVRAAWTTAADLTTLFDAFRQKQPDLIYFYGHGELRNGVGSVQIGRKEWLNIRTFPFELRRKNRWRSQPVVLLNGCTTGLISDALRAPLSDLLFAAGASGIVGTEVRILERSACEFAEAFIPSFIDRGDSLAKALRNGRWAILEQGSVHGLAFVGLARGEMYFRENIVAVPAAA